jgi:CheY-like chemotaxis protein
MHDGTASIRLLVVARRTFRPDDVGLDERIFERVEAVRTIDALEAVVHRTAPDVVVVDTGFPQGRAFAAIAEVASSSPDVAVLALTSAPPPPEDVARAARSGASGFVDVQAGRSEFVEAVRSVAAGGAWFPPEEVRPLLAEVADELTDTSSQRRSRLTGILIGFVPLAGLVAAFMSFLWRKYLGTIGVRPVDIAVDPASRVVDAIVGLSTVLGVFGPLLFIGTWLEMLRGSSLDRGVIGWLLAKRRTLQAVLSVLWLVVAWLITRGPDPFIVLVAGPVVGIGVIARVAGPTTSCRPPCG